VQVDAELMVELKAAGVIPGQVVDVGTISRFGDAVPVTSADGTAAAVTANVAHAVLVRAC
jgi:DtxR family Mn-dependent transcriptional regulator